MVAPKLSYAVPFGWRLSLGYRDNYIRIITLAAGKAIGRT